MFFIHLEKGKTIMSTQNISSAALYVISQYNDAGKSLVGAYRSGAHRLLAGAASRYSDFAIRRESPLVGDNVKANLQGTQERLTGFLAKRLDVDTGRAIALMDRVAEGAAGSVESVAKAVARVEAPLGTSIINALSRWHQPMANMSVKLADTVAAGAKKLEGRAAGASSAAAQTAEEAEVAQPQSTARRARRAAKT